MSHYDYLKDFIKEHKLKECLLEFQGATEGKTRAEREACVEVAFAALAKKFLFGGYLQVNYDGKEVYQIHIKNVEFYYHEENGVVEDNYVYHRNGKFPGRSIPYFPLMTIHSHWSGFDITFENPDKQYRASVLIREYSVFDVKKGQYIHDIHWDSNEKVTNSKIDGEEKKNDSSSYLTFFLNGFSLEEGAAPNVVWKDVLPQPEGDCIPKKRKGIEWRDPVKKSEKDERKWAFYRK